VTTTRAAELLTINEVEVHRFGGLSERTVTLPDDPLVVIVGPNEAGKSTLAELIAWLLAGPVGSAADAQRYGAPSDRIGGRLVGRLGAHPFVATGDFRVLKAGTPNDNGLRVRLDGDLDVARWRARLGGVDSQVLAAVYRLWGEQLHTGRGAHDQLSKVALAALGGRVDPHLLAGELTEEVRRVTTSRAAGARSIAALRHRIVAVEDRRRLAATTAERWAELGQHLTDLDHQRAGIDAHLAAQRSRHRVLSTAIDLVDARAHLLSLELRIEQLGDVPAAWESLAADPPLVHATVHELRSAAAAREHAESELRHGLADLGVTEEAVSHVTATDADLTAVARATARLHEAEQAAHAADAHVEQLRAELHPLVAATDVALTTTGGAMREQVGQVQLGVDEQTALRTASERWADAIERADSAAEQLTSTSELLALAEDRRAHARRVWEQWGRAGSAEDWLAGRLSATPPGAARAVTPWWVPSLLVLVVAVVAAVVGQPLLATAAVVVAAVVGLMSRPAATSAMAGESPADRNESAVAITRSAAAVVDAERAVSDARAAEGEAHAAHAAAARTAKAAQMRVRALCAAVRVSADAAADPPTIDSIHRAWVAASAALRAEVLGRGALDAAVVAADRRWDSVRQIEAHVIDLVRRAGVSGVVVAQSADDVVGRHREVHARFLQVCEARSRAEAAELAYERLVAPVALDIAGWRPDRVLEQVDHVQARCNQRRSLQGDLDTARVALEARLSGDAPLRSLVEAGVAESALRTELVSVECDIADAEQQLREISERVGQLRLTRDELASAEQLAALAVEHGTLREAQEDLAVQALSAALSNSVLRAVADEYERENQPAIIERTLELAGSVAPTWEKLIVRAGDGDRLELFVRQVDRGTVAAEQLSTGARALLYLSLRVAMADHDAHTRGISVPLMCDDPLVHLDDERAALAMQVLQAASASGRQVVVFTCHERTVRAARAAGAGVVVLDGGHPAG
jgi:ABC-type lipoprotein export system ATPase subunit